MNVAISFQYPEPSAPKPPRKLNADIVVFTVAFVFMLIAWSGNLTSAKVSSLVMASISQVALLNETVSAALSFHDDERILINNRADGQMIFSQTTHRYLKFNSVVQHYVHQAWGASQLTPFMRGVELPKRRSYFHS
ncbi:hypothetical protein [Solimicrobium silvestre]|nr:hypothetical protein [Solimicrobium silvestre]